MSKFWKRVKVILTAAPTYLTGAAAVVAVLAEEIAKVLPQHAEPIGALALTVTGWLTCAITIIRRVTPVSRSERGVLPAGEA